jgi:hypothetical protein
MRVGTSRASLLSGATALDTTTSKEAEADPLPGAHDLCVPQLQPLDRLVQEGGTAQERLDQ